MNSAENKNENSLLAGGEPHQREELDQAEAASKASFSLEPEKGISPEPETYNKDAAQENIKQAGTESNRDTSSGGAQGFDPVNEIDLDADENSVTPEDLQALNGIDEDDESTM